uniref:Uncharacterized protein n=1 Tax=Physcomitrium patens TaxID=3218 RepID=A0A2K1K6D6_PHYPA|nr:hypothetical protein PHYPA_011235 [Physcomitrium patens]
MREEFKSETAAQVEEAKGQRREMTWLGQCRWGCLLCKLFHSLSTPPPPCTPPFFLRAPTATTPRCVPRPP